MMYNADTAKRIRRSLRNRFSNGGIVQFIIYGYIKPPGSKSDADLRKDPEAEPIIEEIVRQLEDGATYGQVADWLNARESNPVLMHAPSDERGTCFSARSQPHPQRGTRQKSNDEPAR